MVEQVIADLKASALAHLPSSRFTANAAWLVAATIAFNLTRAVGVTAGGKFARAEGATVRARIINTPARISRSGRSQQLHLPEPGPGPRTGSASGRPRSTPDHDPQPLRPEEIGEAGPDRQNDHAPTPNQRSRPPQQAQHPPTPIDPVDLGLGLDDSGVGQPKHLMRPWRLLDQTNGGLTIDTTSERLHLGPGTAVRTMRVPDWLWPLLASAVTLLSWLPATLTVFPPMAGYLFVPLSLEGVVPYRDFYMPVTPLTFFLAQLSAQLGDVRLVYMLGSLILPPTLTVSIYSLTRLLTSVRASSVLACFGGVSLITFRADIAGGWNSLVVVLTALGSALVVQSLSKGGYRTVLWAAAGGVIAGLAVLAKQTAVVPLGLGFLLLSLMSLSPRSRRESPRIGVSLWSALLGFGLVLGCFTIWLIGQHALGDFTQNMSSFGGKNPSIGGAAYKLMTSLRHFFFAPTTSAVLLAVALWQVASHFGLTRVSRSSSLGRVSLVLLTGVSLGLLFELIRPILPVGQAAAFLVTVVLLALSRVFDPFGSRRKVGALVIVLGLVPLEFAIVLALAYPNPALSSGFVAIESLWVSAAIATAMVIVLWPRVLSAEGEDAKEFSLGSWLEPPAVPRRDTELQPAWPVLVLSAGLTLGTWLVVVQSTAGPVPAAFIIPTSVPLLAGVLVALTRVGALMARGVLLVGAVATTALFVVSAWVSPYVWNGWAQPSVFGRYTAMSEGPLAGMVSRDTVVGFNERLAASIGKASERSAGKIQTLFEFGNFPIVYALSDLAYHQVTVCPNHWIDLCPQDVLLADLGRFAENPSDVVVWAEISEKALRYQEESFGLGRSAYREWSRFRDEQVRNGSWREVDRIEVGERTPNLNPVIIYAVGGK